MAKIENCQPATEQKKDDTTKKLSKHRKNASGEIPCYKRNDLQIAIPPDEKPLETVPREENPRVIPYKKEEKKQNIIKEAPNQDMDIANNGKEEDTLNANDIFPIIQEDKNLPKQDENGSSEEEIRVLTKEREAEISKIPFNEENIQRPRRRSLTQSVATDPFQVHSCDRIITDPMEISLVLPKDALEFVKALKEEQQKGDDLQQVHSEEKKKVEGKQEDTKIVPPPEKKEEKKVEEQKFSLVKAEMEKTQSISSNTNEQISGKRELASVQAQKGPAPK